MCKYSYFTSKETERLICWKIEIGAGVGNVMWGKLRVMEPFSRLPTEVMAPPSLEIFISCPGTILSCVFYVPMLEQWGQSRVLFPPLLLCDSVTFFSKDYWESLVCVIFLVPLWHCMPSKETARSKKKSCFPVRALYLVLLKLLAYLTSCQKQFLFYSYGSLHLKKVWWKISVWKEKEEGKMSEQFWAFVLIAE